MTYNCRTKTGSTTEKLIHNNLGMVNLTTKSVGTVRERERRLK